MTKLEFKRVTALGKDEKPISTDEKGILMVHAKIESSGPGDPGEPRLLAPKSPCSRI